MDNARKAEKWIKLKFLWPCRSSLWNLFSVTHADPIFLIYLFIFFTRDKSKNLTNCCTLRNKRSDIETMVFKNKWVNKKMALKKDKRLLKENVTTDACHCFYV